MVPLQISPGRFRSTLKIKVSSHKKKFKIFFSSKIATTIFVKFCGSILHSISNTMALYAFPEKKKQSLIFCPSPYVAPKPTNLVHIRYPGSPCKYLQVVFDLPSKLRVFHIRKSLKFSFSRKYLQRFSSNFVDLLYIRTATI